MIDFVGANGAALTFLRDERKVRRGAEFKANWRENGVFRARLKLREAMLKIRSLQSSSIYFNWIIGWFEYVEAW